MNPESIETEQPATEARHGRGAEVREPRRRSSLLRYTVPAIFLALFAWLAYWRMDTRSHVQAQIAASAASDDVAVTVVRPERSATGQDVQIPGNVQAFVETPIYARTSGYLKTWSTDIGAHVTAGQLLALIDTPEVDQQLRQAEAAQLQAQANLDLAKSTAERWENLLKSDGVSQQEVDQNVSAYKARQADYEAAVANVDRLKYLQDFKRVTAPFSGVITARNVDIGALISPSTTQPLFRLAQIDVLRVYVNVPESYGNQIAPGMAAELALSEFPNRTFHGKVVRTAGAIDQASRTLLTEVDVPNPKNELLPGAYAEVGFHLAKGALPLVIPSNTMIFRAAGAQVAVVENRKVHLRNVTIGRDFGTKLEIVSGLSDADQVILNPPDSLAEGQMVAVQGHPDAAPAAPASPAGAGH